MEGKIKYWIELSDYNLDTKVNALKLFKIPKRF